MCFDDVKSGTGAKKVRFDEVKSGTFSKKVYLSWSKRTEKLDTSAVHNKSCNAKLPNIFDMYDVGMICYRWQCLLDFVVSVWAHI